MGIHELLHTFDHLGNMSQVGTYLSLDFIFYNYIVSLPAVALEIQRCLILIVIVLNQRSFFSLHLTMLCTFWCCFKHTPTDIQPTLQACLVYGY
jgi:hypothetical protein